MACFSAKYDELIVESLLPSEDTCVVFTLEAGGELGSILTLLRSGDIAVEDDVNDVVYDWSADIDTEGIGSSSSMTIGWVENLARDPSVGKPSIPSPNPSPTFFGSSATGLIGVDLPDPDPRSISSLWRRADAAPFVELG